MEDDMDQTATETAGDSVEEGVVSTPADSGSDASTAPESASTAPETPKEPEEPKAPEFDWDGWDGKLENLPEEARFWAEGVQGRVTAEHEAKIAEANKARETYDAIISGMEDPRLKELEEKIASGDATRAEIQEKLQATTEQNQKLQEAYEELVTTQAEAEYASFKAEFGELLNDEKKAADLQKLLEDDLFSAAELKDLGNLVTLDQEAREEVRAILKKENVSVGFAIQFAQATRNKPAPTQEAPKNDARKLVAGATRAGRPPKAVRGEGNIAKPKSLEEAKKRVTEKYAHRFN